MRRLSADAGVKIVDALRALAERQSRAFEAELGERGFEHIERAGIGRRYARALDQRLRQLNGVDGFGQKLCSRHRLT